MKTIVVGYDDSDASKRALERAAELAKAFGSALVVTSVAGTAAGGSGRSMGGEDPTESREAHAAELGHAEATLGALGLQADYVVGVGDAADAIVELADQRSADLIVVGTREAGLWDRLLAPSVSGAVSRHAHCDVLIVH
jgi:nucleotide-binding universal stress UspA family protein